MDRNVSEILCRPGIPDTESEPIIIDGCSILSIENVDTDEYCKARFMIKITLILRSNTYSEVA